MRSFRAMGMVVPVCVLAFVGLLLFLASPGKRTSYRRVPPAQHALTRIFDPAQLKAFHVLRGKAEPLPARLQMILSDFREEEIKNLWFEHAKQVSTSDGNLWIVDGEGVTCIVQEEGSISCVKTAIFLRRGVILGIFAPVKHATEKPNKFFAWGVAPDWAKRVQLMVGNDTQTIIVRNNGYALRAHSPIILDKLEH